MGWNTNIFGCDTDFWGRIRIFSRVLSASSENAVRKSTLVLSANMCPSSSYPFYKVTYYIKWVLLLGHIVGTQGETSVKYSCGCSQHSNHPDHQHRDQLLLYYLKYNLILHCPHKVSYVFGSNSLTTNIGTEISEIQVVHI